MSEISVRFRTALSGYNKKEVDAFLKDEIETRLQQKSSQIADLQKQVQELEERLELLAGGDLSVAEKAVSYDRLMKKMDGDYEKLLAPAVAKAKAIEEKAEQEYQARMEQAELAKKVVCSKTSEEINALIAQAVRENFQTLEEEAEKYIYSKTLTGRVENLLKRCGSAIAEAGSRVQTRIRGSKE